MPAPKLKIGTLRHCVTLQTLVETVDQYGQLRQSWDDVATTKAAIRTPTGRDKVNADQLKVQLSHVVTMRYRTLPDGTEIDPTNQLSFRGRTLRITHAIDVDQRHIVLELYCSEQPGEAEEDSGQ